jgi:hypothetical protein
VWNSYQVVPPGATDALAAIATAISNLPPSGGCVDARQLSGSLPGAVTVVVNKPVTLLLGPVQIQATANPAFQVQGNWTPTSSGVSSLTVLGLDPNASMIVATVPNQILFEVSGVFVAPGSDYVGGETLTIKRCGLSGGTYNSPTAGTMMVHAEANGSSNNFTQGLLLIEDNLIQFFGGTAIWIGAAVYFIRIHRNYFLANQQAIYLDNNTEASITENWFMQGQGPNAGPSITSVGPMHRIVHNYFYRYALSDTGNQPDILLQPQSGWQSQAGGYVWIEDNRFGNELENLDPLRRRIVLKASDSALIAGPAIVRGNQFLGPQTQVTISSAGTTAIVTVDQAHGWSTQGLVAGQSWVVVYNAPQAPLNGTFLVQTVTPPATFTYTLNAGFNTQAPVTAAMRLAGATAIELDNPHLPWDVSGNFFVNYGVLIDDNQDLPISPSQPGNSAYGWGESLFVDNRVICPSGGYSVFANQGNDFTWVRPPANSPLKAMDAWPKQIETRALRNRVPQSELLNQWTAVNCQPASGGVNDPFGTLRAYSISLSGTAANQHIASAYIDATNLPQTSRLVVKFWAKQGSLNALCVGIWVASGSGGWFGNFFPVSLGPDWKQYKFVTNQLCSYLGNNFQLCFYPGDSNCSSGNVNVFGPQVSDDDSDYYPTGPTASSFVTDSSAGSRFEKAVILTSLKTTTHTGDPSSAPSVTSSNLGTGGSATLQAGSTDFSGVIVLTPGSGASTTGNVTISFNVPYVGTNAPIVVATLQDGTNPWSHGTSQVRVFASSGQSCTLTWVNSSALTANKTYLISYVVIWTA